VWARRREKKKGEGRKKREGRRAKRIMTHDAATGLWPALQPIERREEEERSAPGTMAVVYFALWGKKKKRRKKKRDSGDCSG